MTRGQAWVRACWACWVRCWRAGRAGGRAGVLMRACRAVQGVLGVQESPMRDLGKSCPLLPSKTALVFATRREIRNGKSPLLDQPRFYQASSPGFVKISQWRLQHGQPARPASTRSTPSTPSTPARTVARPVGVLSTPIEHAQHASTEPSPPSTPVPKLGHAACGMRHAACGIRGCRRSVAPLLC
jgi:hypothetical protein